MSVFVDLACWCFYIAFKSITRVAEDVCWSVKLVMFVLAFLVFLVIVCRGCFGADFAVGADFRSLSCSCRITSSMFSCMRFDDASSRSATAAYC